MRTLLLVLIMATSAVAQENLLGLSAKALKANGAILMVGGGSTPKEISDEFVKLAGGKDANIVFIISASDWAPGEVQQRFRNWLDYKVAKLDFLDASTKQEADSDSFVGRLSKATGIWFTGGNQNRLAERYLGTKTQVAIQNVLESGGVVGGSSAGAAVQSAVMIQQGQEPELGTGFGLATRAVIDTHFTERGRQARLLRAIAQRPGYVGVGLDEGTALVVRGSKVRAIGRAGVTVCIDNLSKLLHAGEETDLSQVFIVKPTIARTP